MDFSLIVILGILLGCFLGLSWFAGSDAPFVPSKLEAIRKILKAAGVKKGKKFYELGSGDGRVAIEAAKLSAETVGIEQSWVRVLYSKYKSRHLKNVHFWHGNIFSSIYSDADFIYIYLLLKGVTKLEGKLKKELKKGTILITQTYHFPNWKPFKKIDLSKEFDFSKDIKGAGVFWLYKQS